MTKYILTNEPRTSGTMIAGAFDALDQAFGTEEFTETQALQAITAQMDFGTTGAESLLRDLIEKGHIEGTPSTRAPRSTSPDEALKEIERVDKLLDQHGVQWEKG